MPATVLAYHAVGECPRSDDPNSLWVPSSTFGAQMAYLARARRVVPLEAVVSGDYGPGRPAVAITFDDAYRSVLTNAVPILRGFGFPATIFAPTAFLGDRNRWDPPTDPPLEILSDEELREVEANGVRVESHGHGHLDLSEASDDEARVDLARSIERLEDAVGRRPRLLAYPFRTGSAGARRAAAALGFRAAFTIDIPHDGPHAWGRVGVAPGDGSALFALKTSGRYLAWRHQAVLAAAYRLVRRVRPRG